MHCMLLSSDGSATYKSVAVLVQCILSYYAITIKLEMSYFTSYSVLLMYFHYYDLEKYIK